MQNWPAASCAAFIAMGILTQQRTASAQSQTLPDAPAARLIASASQSAPVSAPASATQSETSGAQPNAAVVNGPTLTLAQAEQLAIKNNPNISVARLLALAQAQVTREARSAEMPTAVGDLTAVGAHENTRITAGYLSNSSVYDRAAGGLTVSQLITDFGRTHNLVLSALSNAKAQLESERATELDITLTTDQAFYHALTAQAVFK
ncbi:MAG: TolC family protein, partial [Terracidiphilus sp.]